MRMNSSLGRWFALYVNQFKKYARNSLHFSEVILVFRVVYWHFCIEVYKHFFSLQLLFSAYII